MSLLSDLECHLQGCESCVLSESRHRIVFGAGPENTDVMAVGEAPGEEEDHKGVPFIGAAGQKLDKMLQFAGLTRDKVYITNAVLCRPPENRTPASHEIEACRWRLQNQIDFIRPKLIICLGKAAYEALSGKQIKGRLTQLFGGWISYDSDLHHCRIIVTFHPSYHLRRPKQAYDKALPQWNAIKDFVHEIQIGSNASRGED